MPGWLPSRESPCLRVSLLICFTLLVCLRLPEVVLHGRFWAEEGRVFYVRAATMPWPKALFDPFAGYLNLVASAAAIIARWISPLEYAPWITTTIGLAIQCCPAILLISSKDDWLRPRAVLIASLLLVGLPPLCEEIWLQTLGSQFQLTLCCVLILGLDLPRSGGAWFRGTLLFLAPLSGPSAIAVLPLFLVRAVVDRSPGRLYQALPLGLGTAIQLGFFYAHEPGRMYGIAPTILACVIFIKQLVVPLIGKTAGIHESEIIQMDLATHHYPWLPVSATLIAFLSFAAILIRQRIAVAYWFFASGCLLAWVSYYGAINGGQNLLLIGNDERYSFLPEVLSALSLLALAASQLRPFRQSAARWSITLCARILVVWLLLVGVEDAASPLLASAEGPSWLAEIAIWRKDHTHRIAIWPAGWFMTLGAANDCQSNSIL